MKFLSVDVGTTCCKCQLFAENGAIEEYLSREYALKKIGGECYVDLGAIKENVFSMIGEIAKKHEIPSICISSMGEAFTLLDKDDNVLFYPMLYTDPRGEKQARNFAEKAGKACVFAITGTVPHSMYSVSKLLWLKENRQELFEQADKVLLICDYLGYLLTGERVIDYALAARTGVFDVYRKEFSKELLSEVGIDPELFSRPRPAGSVVGKVKTAAARALGLNDNCALVLGSHDQVCATLGAGVLEAGQSADGMGTVECITATFSASQTQLKFGEMGYCVVPYPGDLYCTYIFNYSSNSLVNWYRRELLHGYDGGEGDQFSYLEKGGLSEVLVLPYFSGAATPYCDMNAKGAFLNLTTQTKDADLYRAILESTNFEMKLNLDVVKEYGITVKEITATGGGANSALWLRIKADILGVRVRALRSSEGGLCGCAMLQAAALGLCGDLREAAKLFVRYRGELAPQSDHAEFYERKYEKYKKLYRILKEIN